MQKKLKKEWQRPSIISELSIKQTLGDFKGGGDKKQKGRPS